MARNPDNASRDAQRQVLATLLIAGRTIEQSAAELGVDVSTAYRWARRPEVAEVVLTGRDALRSAVVSQLVAACSTAVETLVDVMSTSRSDAARVNAARCVLEEARASIELDDLARRVAAVEQAERSSTISAAELRELVFGTSVD